jgi:hypothetical protein
MGAQGSGRTDETGAMVYDWLSRKANEDGEIETACANIAMEINKPLSTVQHAVNRLQKRGKIVMIGPREFVVVDMAGLDDM